MQALSIITKCSNLNLIQAMEEKYAKQSVQKREYQQNLRTRVEEGDQDAINQIKRKNAQDREYRQNLRTRAEEDS